MMGTRGMRPAKRLQNSYNGYETFMRSTRQAQEV